jgi:hypothetical protein
VEVSQVRPRENHPVQDRAELGVRLLPDRLDLALVAVTSSLLFEEGTEGGDVAPPEHFPEPPDIIPIVGH